MDHLCYLSLVFVMLLRQFIAALWSLAGKGLTTRHSLCFCHFPMCYPGAGVVLNCIDSFLIFAAFLTFLTTTFFLFPLQHLTIADNSVHL